MAARVVTALPKFGHKSGENLEFFLVYFICEKVSRMLAEQLLFESAPHIIMVCDIVASWSLRP